MYLATAPKSNRVTVALGRARQDARGHDRGDVPMHLRDAHYRGAGSLGHGDGYRYPHDDGGRLGGAAVPPEWPRGSRLLRAERPRTRGRAGRPARQPSAKTTSREDLPGRLPAMSVAEVVVLVAAVVACMAALVCLVSAVVLVGAVRRLERGVESLRSETVPLVSDAREVMDHATTELARVGAVLEGTESVTATVDSASRMAQRALTNPVVKVLAIRAGAATGLRHLRSPKASA